MAKVRPVSLCEHFEYVKKESGGYELQKSGERVVPAHLTMHALLFGQKEGLIESSILDEIASNLTEHNALKLIYMACEGARPGFHKEVPFETFAMQLNVNLNEVQFVAQSLLIDSMPDTVGEFQKAMEKVTRDEDPDVKK